jgi:hypothetical protein
MGAAVMLKLSRDSATIVLAGYFNPAILLEPQWIAKHGLELPVGTNVNAKMSISPGAGITRTDVNEIAYSLSQGVLTFFVKPLVPSQCEKTTQVAAKILSKLLYTPVVGVGFNFSFEGEANPDKIQSIFWSDAIATDLVNAQGEIAIRRVSNSIKTNQFMLTVDHELTAEKRSIRFNFHYSTADSAAACEILKNHALCSAHFDSALKIAEKHFELNLDRTE